MAPEDQLDEILRTRAIRIVYQPIVELVTGDVVAYEALARGPEGSALERPDLLFELARTSGRLAELDWLCRTLALQGALDAGSEPPLRLFINAAADALDAPPPDEARALIELARGRVEAVLEITEQAIAVKPAEILHAVDSMRGLGAMIALDDVGAVVRSLALMPLIAPDVIKLDLRLVQDEPSERIAETATAVSAEAERTGAVILAEGIKTAEQATTALALGATHGQGWLFGRPEPLPAVLPRPTVGLGRRREAAIIEPLTPFEIVTAERDVRQGEKALLLTISRQLERQAAVQGTSTVIMSAFQEARHFTPKTGDLYAALATRLAFVGALARDLPLEPAPGVRGAGIPDDAKLLREWNVTVVAPHFAAAFVGRDLGDDVPDAERRFDFALTYDRDLAVRAARALMREITPR